MTTADTHRTSRLGEVGRRAENVLAYAGAAQALFAGVMESLVRAGLRLGEGDAQTGIPWVNLAVLLVCVLPKTVGRRTGGTVWRAIAERFGGPKP